ncbi:MAG: carbonic anhydrase [Nitrosomonadales bacterium]|jgi:carbonic anhydrase|nr:carbonic anhydrase [Nitrosomonadales bacterium]MBT3917880.1 carbonic anhydrase [Nitrosomonadales bacterium]MBT4759032.1 carbonic anhydrase [Nitrosomonadales bacterium]MBT6014633.1 carbonic anhydrase [Nitrosomonadales bacterium]MBT6603190.1 carbonic anhydrase [Nitrosomonadales bacterium]
MSILKKINRENLSPKEALEILVEGNQRFINDVKRDQNLSLVREELKEKQQPFAAVLGCSDSRTSLELIFDQSLGDIFSVRLAGNVACRKAIGSLEYSCKYLGSKIIVVMGHSNCGAVKAACDNFKEGNIEEITKLLQPAVSDEKTIPDSERNSENSDFVSRVCFLNVQKQMEVIVNQSDIVKDLLQKKQIGIIGGVYSLTSGLVEFDHQNAIFS